MFVNKLFEKFSEKWGRIYLGSGHCPRIIKKVFWRVIPAPRKQFPSPQLDIFSSCAKMSIRQIEGDRPEERFLFLPHR